MYADRVFSETDSFISFFNHSTQTDSNIFDIEEIIQFITILLDRRNSLIRREGSCLVVGGRMPL